MEAIESRKDTALSLDTVEKLRRMKHFYASPESIEEVRWMFRAEIQLAVDFMQAMPVKGEKQCGKDAKLARSMERWYEIISAYYSTLKYRKLRMSS